LKERGIGVAVVMAVVIIIIAAVGTVGYYRGPEKFKLKYMC
jgi:hypothetical protein